MTTIDLVRAAPGTAPSDEGPSDEGPSDAGPPPDGPQDVRRSELLVLREIHARALSPADPCDTTRRIGPEELARKHEIERRLLADLDARCGSPVVDGPDDAVDQVRRIASADLLPPVYAWLAEQATWPDVVAFLVLEGGPDAGFDDLVAVAQVGIDGPAKVVMAANYWDEMGRGEPAAVHAELHRALVGVIGTGITEAGSVAALERSVLHGVLATERTLQPELIGALGLTEMQAGPRCRAVVRALDRLDAPPAARAFYEEHATADPRHGKEWLDGVIRPLAARPGWAQGIVRGVRWRAEVNRRLFAELHRRLVGR
ncbi:MAG: iron-containing redox enzyme family protein [Acidimicrobiales bacterium]|jgi:hypothetical protein|nr:iron-containing redox enzyme family protein [Acidimicrobiales bacterium]